MHLRRNYIWLLPLLALLTSPLWWDAAGRLLGPRVSAVTAPPPASQQLMNTFVMHRVVVSQSRSGFEELHVKADLVQTGEDAEELRMYSVAGQLFGRQRSLSVTGGKAMYDQVRQIFTISGQVKLVSSDGYRFESDLLRYYPRESKLRTDEPVSLTGTGVRMRGEGLVYDLDSGDIRLGGRVMVDFS